AVPSPRRHGLHRRDRPASHHQPREGPRLVRPARRGSARAGLNPRTGATHRRSRRHPVRRLYDPPPTDLDGTRGRGLPRSPPTPAELLGAYSEAVVSVVEAVGPSVVSIRTNVRAGRRGGAGAGSGVIIAADGYVLTNSHVVRGATDLEVSLTDGRRFSATPTGDDPG